MKLYVLIAFIVYGIPLWKYRYDFRSMVYRDRSWRVNFTPRFVKETVALFSNRHFKGKKEIRAAWFFRMYLLGYFTLFALLFV
jgi:hypothetical protein